MLMEFYGQECPHCMRMQELSKKLEAEESVTLERFEVWHNEENLKKQEELDNGQCGGVPFYYNTDNKKFLCGEVEYEELKAWAKGE